MAVAAAITVAELAAEAAAEAVAETVAGKERPLRDQCENAFLLRISYGTSYKLSAIET